MLHRLDILIRPIGNWIEALATQVPDRHRNSGVGGAPTQLTGSEVGAVKSGVVVLTSIVDAGVVRVAYD